MGRFKKIFRSLVGKGEALTNYSDFWYGGLGIKTKTGVSVNEENSLKYLTILACTSLISADIARLPLIMYKRRPGGGKDRIIDDSLADVMHNAANPNMTAFNYRESAQNHLLLWGNAFSVIKRNPYTGDILGLDLLPNPGKVSVRNNKSGNLLYSWEKNGKQIVKTRKDIFHIPGFGWNGLVGMSMVALAREAIGLGLATEEYGASYFGEGIHPAGIYELEGYLGDNREDFLKGLKDGVAGLGKAHNIMVAEGGAKYKPLSFPLNDAQFIETRSYQKTEICGIYRVPPHKVALHGKNSNYNNLEQENASYVDSCLVHWATRWEQNISLQLISPEKRREGYFFEFLMAGLLRGDSQARSEYYTKLFQVGALSPNQILAKENMNSIEGGDQHFVQLNMIPLGQVEQSINEQRLATGKRNEKREIEHRGDPGIALRDRITKQYMPLFRQSAQDIVSKEGLAVKKQINQQRKQRSRTDMESWLNAFYAKFDVDIKSKLGAVMRSFGEAIQFMAMDEINAQSVSGIDSFIDDYIKRYTERHIDSSKGQLISLLGDDLTELEKRVDEWHEKRADKIAINETTRESNAVYQAVAFGAGMSTVWRIRGAKTCPYCRTLSGKRISKGQYYYKTGDEIKIDGYDTMKINGRKSAPPLHAKCDCYASII